MPVFIEALFTIAKTRVNQYTNKGNLDICTMKHNTAIKKKIPSFLTVVNTWSSSCLLENGSTGIF